VNQSANPNNNPASPTAAVTPKDAAAVILLRHQTSSDHPEVFLVKRSEKLAFLGGYHAFPGGQFDRTDAEVLVESAANVELATAIACAARELFEETQVLVARGGDALTQGQRASLLDDLQAGLMSWPALLKHYELHLDASDFTFVGRWVTPPFSARRFDTWFFLVNCPAKQQANLASEGELESGEWIAAGAAHARWERSEILAVPPVLHALKTLSTGVTDDLVERFLSSPNAAGRTLHSILLTHVHPDHVGGVNALRTHFPNVRVSAHRLTASALPDIEIAATLEDENVIVLKGEPRIAFRVMHTPGHARGHLCLFEERTGTLISGDNIVGLGSVLIDPPEGNMRDYLRSLERMRALPNLSVIFGGHGPAIGNPYRKIDEYISHRLEREQKILEAVHEGAATPKNIVARVYTDVSPKAHAMAERAVLAHLEKLIEDGAVQEKEPGLFQNR